MNLSFSITTLLAATALCGSAIFAATAHNPGHRSADTAEAEEGPVADCTGLHIRMEGQAATIRSEERTIPRSAGTLTVQSEVSGGLQVQGWDKGLVLAHGLQSCRCFLFGR
jgi:hypothetical protein